MIESVRIAGAGGRVGSAVSARLAERGIELDGPSPQLVLLCVPDRAIAEVAAETPLGPWVAHVSGATPLTALEPHVRRFSVHPLQSFSRARGPEQLDGAWAAVTAETPEARDRRTRARRDARPPAVRPRGRPPRRVPRGRGDGLELPRHSAGRGRIAPEGGGRAAGGARPADPRRGRRRLRAHGPDRARGLGHRAAPSRGDSRRAPRAGGAVRRPRRGDRPHRRAAAPK